MNLLPQRNQPDAERSITLQHRLARQSLRVCELYCTDPRRFIPKANAYKTKKRLTLAEGLVISFKAFVDTRRGLLVALIRS